MEIVELIDPPYSPSAEEVDARRAEFCKGLENLVNRYSMEADSDTPDFILAEYLMNCFDAFNNAVNIRQKWYAPELPLYEQS